MPMHESSCIENPSFYEVSLRCQLVSSSFDCLLCLTARTLWLTLESSFIVIFMFHALCERCFWSLRHLHSLPLYLHHLSDHFAVPTARHQLPWCRGEIPCVLPVRTLATLPRTFIPQGQKSRHFDSSSTTRMAKVMVQYGRPSSSFFWAKSVWSSFGTTYGKGNLRKSYWNNGWEKISNRECLFKNVKNDYYYLCMWTTWNWLERKKILIRCRKYSLLKSIWENQHLSWIMYTWAALKDNAK